MHHARSLITLQHTELFCPTPRKVFAGIDPNVGSLSSVKTHQNQDPFEGKVKSKRRKGKKAMGPDCNVSMLLLNLILIIQKTVLIRIGSWKSYL